MCANMHSCVTCNDAIEHVWGAVVLLCSIPFEDLHTLAVTAVCRRLFNSSSSYLLQDVVTRGGKFLFMYKRPGRRVIVNNTGRMMVCPSHLEQSIQQDTVGMPQLTNVNAHFCPISALL